MTRRGATCESNLVLERDGQVSGQSLCRRPAQHKGLCRAAFTVSTGDDRSVLFERGDRYDVERRKIVTGTK